MVVLEKKIGNLIICAYDDCFALIHAMSRYYWDKMEVLDKARQPPRMSI